MTLLKDSEIIEFDTDDENFEDFTRISIVETKIDKFPQGILSQFLNIKELVLSENGMSTWTSTYLQNGETLSYLYVAKNPIEHLTADSFDGR